MINLSQNGMRCRATKAIRAHQGLVRCSTKGTIQGVVDSLGRQLINVKWETGITYVFLNEIEMIESVQLARTIHAWQRSRREPSGARQWVCVWERPANWTSRAITWERCER